MQALNADVGDRTFWFHSSDCFVERLRASSRCKRSRRPIFQTNSLFIPDNSDQRSVAIHAENLFPVLYLAVFFCSLCFSLYSLKLIQKSVSLCSNNHQFLETNYTSPADYIDSEGKQFVQILLILYWLWRMTAFCWFIFPFKIWGRNWALSLQESLPTSLRIQYHVF